MAPTDPARRQRILRQNVLTDRLLGADAVPTNKPVTDAPPAVAAEPDAATKAQLLDEIDRNEVRNCTNCDLCRSRTQTVFGDGDANARLMFIGEGPGQNEDEQGVPFVGRAGELLTKMIVAMGLSRQEVYIGNVVKCRPPNNRTPTPDEVAACSGYLQRQIAVIRPTVIVTLGAPATKLMLNTKEGITSIRGTWRQYASPDLSEPIGVMPTFHPAYLLRSYTPDNRGKVWSDLQKVMAKLSEPDA